MKKLQLLVILFFLLISMPIVYLFASNMERIDYPDNYRSWTHVKSAIINEKHPLFESFGGIHHVYANSIALKALKDKSAYPDGATLVFDLRSASPYEGGINEGKRRRIDVMQKDQKKFKDSGGWGYGSFSGDSQNLIRQNVIEKCFSCHLSQKENHYVFSEIEF